MVVLRPRRLRGQLGCSKLMLDYFFVVSDGMSHCFFGQTSKHSTFILGLSIYHDSFDIVESLIFDKIIDFWMFLFIFLKKEQNVEDMTIVSFL